MKDTPSLPGWPMGLGRDLAAAYVGVSVSTFDAMVRAGHFPRPRRLGRRVVWIRTELDIVLVGGPRMMPDQVAPTGSDPDPFLEGLAI